MIRAHRLLLPPLVALASTAACERPPDAPAAGAATYGAPVASGSTLPLAEVLRAPARYDGKEVVVEGHVRRACTRRGCWMELAEGPTPEGQGCRVTFKDYGFFVPTDSAGAAARVQGVVEATTVPADQVTHLESEGGTFAVKEADGSAREIRIVASGVELTRG